MMTSRPRTRVSVQAPSGGVTDWYQSQGYREPGRISSMLCYGFISALRLSFPEFMLLAVIVALELYFAMSLRLSCAYLFSAVYVCITLPTPLVILLFDFEDDFEHSSHTVETSKSSRYVSISLTSRNSWKHAY
ncbi:hypothetical protein Tco_1410171 [Tanacetum coccineum]